MNLAKAMMYGVLFGSVGVGTASAAFYIEAEDATEIYPFAPVAYVEAEGAGTFASEEMSSDQYLEMPATSYASYQIAADSVPAGTYFVALRSNSSDSRGLNFDWANSLQTVTGVYNTVGSSFNAANGTDGLFGWDWAYDAANSAQILTVTISAGQANTFRVNNANGVAISNDLFGFLDTDTLPTGVPEPASIGLLAVGTALLAGRHRKFAK